MYLDGPVDHGAGHQRGHRLDLRDQRERSPVAVLVDGPRRLLAQQSRLIDLVAGECDLLLHHALIGERPAEGDAGPGALGHQRQGALSHPDGAHTVVDTPGAQPGLRDREPHPLLRQQVRCRHPDVVVDDLGVAVLVLPAEHRSGSENVDSRRVDRHQDHRLLLMRGGLRVGAAHHDQDRAARVVGAGGPPLAAVDDVIATVADDRRFDIACVTGGHRRFGHREGAADLTGQQRIEPPILLLVGAEHVQHFHIAGVRSCAVHRLRGDLGAPAAEFRQRRVFQIGQPGHTGQEQIPQSGFPGRLLQFLDNRWDGEVTGAGHGAVLVIGFLGRQHVIDHEVGEAAMMIGRLGGHGEIHIRNHRPHRQTGGPVVGAGHCGLTARRGHRRYR